MGQPNNLILDHRIENDGKELNVHLLNTGVDHAVVFVDDLEKFCVNTLGKKIRYHRDFLPVGVYVNFVQRKNKDILVRTYEKGVESETRSCGSGGCAVVVVLSKLFSYSVKKFLLEEEI